MTYQVKKLLGTCLKGEKPAWDSFVTDREAEEIFFNRPLLVAQSVKEPTEVRTD